MRKILTLAALLLLPVLAWAADGTLAVTPGSGTTLVVSPDGSGNVVPHSIACDHLTPTQCENVNSSGQLVVTIPSQGPVTGATAATSSDLAGGIYNSSPPALSTGQQAGIQLDSSGNLKVNVAAGGTITQGSTTSGQAGALIMGATTTAAPSYSTGDTNPLSTDLNGGLRLSPACTGVINIAQTATADVHTFTHLGYICSIVLVSATA